MFRKNKEYMETPSGIRIESEQHFRLRMMRVQSAIWRKDMRKKRIREGRRVRRLKGIKRVVGTGKLVVGDIKDLWWWHE